jgi:hypothetical protein
MIGKKLTRSENINSKWPNIEDLMVEKTAFFDKHSYNFFRLDLTLPGLSVNYHLCLSNKIK